MLPRCERREGRRAARAEKGSSVHDADATAGSRHASSFTVDQIVREVQTVQEVPKACRAVAGHRAAKAGAVLMVPEVPKVLRSLASSHVVTAFHRAEYAEIFGRIRNLSARLRVLCVLCG